MNIQGSFGFGQGYTVHWDKPKTNGTGAGQQKDNSTGDQASKAYGSTDDNQKGNESHGCTHSWDDPDWSILDDRRGNLPEFPIDTLPAPWRAWLERAAHGAGVTTAHVAVPLQGLEQIAALRSCGNTSAAVHPIITPRSPGRSATGSSR